MEQKSFVLENGGMNRDLSVSKAGKSSVFENRNIRVEARENDTLLTMTNERGTSAVSSVEVSGTLIGWNVLGKFIILFTAGTQTVNTEVVNVSRIYRIKYDNGSFTYTKIFEGDLGFSVDYPIESIVDYETEDIQKIYWVDGINVLRFLVFSDSYLLAHLTSGELDNPSRPAEFSFSEDTTWFDSTRPSLQIPSAKITKDNSSGNKRPNGTVQYFLSYYNKYGQQTGIIYSSPLVYLSPTDRGGAADETNNNQITLEFSGLDNSYENVRLYEIVRTSEDGTVVAYLVAETSISDSSATFIDDGTNLGTVDPTSFLYLGSQEVHAGTIAQKDNTLFLGNFSSIGNGSIGDLKTVIQQNAFYLSGTTFAYGKDWESRIVEFERTSNNDVNSPEGNIPYAIADGYYPYKSSLNYNNSQITSFKGGEKYRFALRFYRADGTSSQAFWIGDKVNPLYPKISSSTAISRPIAKCIIPDEIITAAVAAGFSSAQLFVAKATNGDRSVFAQGIVCPTVFNLYNRYNGYAFSQASWMYRPKYGPFPFSHFAGMKNPYTPEAELQCAWGGSFDFEPTPLYSLTSGNVLTPTPYGYNGRNYIYITASITTKYAALFDSYNISFTLTISYYSDAQGSNEEKFVTNCSHKSLDNATQVWLNAYDRAEVPGQFRLSEVLRNSPDETSIWHELMQVGTHTYKLYGSNDKQQIDPKTATYDSVYSEYNKQHYFVDESIVTLNSPEVDYENINIDRASDLKFRVVGASGVTGNIADYLIEATHSEIAGENVVDVDLSKPNISTNAHGLGSWTLYIDNYAADASAAFAMYMWHKHGSISQRYDSDNVAYSELQKKIFANLRFAMYTVYNDYKQNEWSVSPADVRQVNDISKRLYDLRVGTEKVMYSSGADDFVTMPGDTTYPILLSQKVARDEESYSVSGSTESSDPVRIAYTSKPHIVMSLRNNAILPYLFGDDAVQLVGKYAPWQKVSYSGKYTIYRDVDFSDPSEVEDVTKGAIGPFSILETNVEAGTMTVRAAASGSTTYVALGDVLENVISAGDGISSNGYYIHAADAGDDVRLVEMSSMRKVLTKAHAESYGNLGGRLGIDCTITSSFRMKSITFKLYGYYQGNAVVLQEYTRTGSMTSSKFSFTPVSLASGYTTYKVGYLVKYDVREYQENLPLIPDLDRSSYANAIEVNTSIRNAYATHRDWFLGENAKYIEISALSENTQFIDIAEGNAVLEYDGSKFVFNSILTPEYTTATHVEYKLPTNNLIKGGQCFLIGEVYKDYDEIAKTNPSADLRYGGISKSAVDNNIFITAGPKKALTDTSPVEQYATAEFDLSSLYEYVISRSLLQTYNITATISGTGEAPSQVISLDDINILSGDDFLPTSENKVSTLTVQKNDSDEWYSAITELSPALVELIAESPDYKIALLRHGYARRGTFRYYTNKYGETQTSHTVRDRNYKLMRRGYKNGLPAQRLRIIGIDLLISSNVQSWINNSMTYQCDAYRNATLISSLGDSLTLPTIPRKHISRNGRISSPGRTNRTYLFIGLYHREEGEWKLVSNAVQVRGTTSGKEHIWEFDKENIVE